MDDLRGFLAVAKTENLTAAAEALSISQSTLSRRIQRLESELGQPLFERTSRAMALSELGRRFIERARLVVSVLDEASAEFADAPDTGAVRVGAIPTVAPYLIPRVLMGFAQQFPQASVSVQEHTTEQLLEACRDGEVDIAILARPFDSHHLETVELYEEQLLLLLPKNHTLAGQASVAVEQVKDEPMVLLNDEHCLTSTVTTFCHDRSLRMVNVERVHQLSMLQELVALGHGVSLVPELAARCDASPSRIYRPLDERAPTRHIVMIRNPYRYKTKIVQAFWAFLRDQSVDYALTE